MNEHAAHRLWVRARGKRAHLPFAPRASQSIEPEGAFHEHGPLDVARRCEQLPLREIATRELALEGGDKPRWQWGRVGARRVCDRGGEVLPEELAAERVYGQ